MTEEPTYGKYIVIWLWLVGLMIGSVAVSLFPLGGTTVAVIIFSLALVKAVLVALYFMHLRFEHFAYSLIALTPVLLFVILTLALFPDFVN